MNLKNTIENKFPGKKGGYIVEASISLPVLVLCVCALALIIRIIAVCEAMCFVTAEEVLKADLEAYKIINSVSLCKDIKNKVRQEGLSDFKVTRFKYLYNQGDMTDLIAIEATGQFNVVNAIGVNGKIRFEEKLLTRGFTGALQNGEPLAEDEFCRGGLSQEVVVFPKYGIRYHEPDCYYVTQQEKDNPCKLEMEREDASRKGYTPCKVCHGAANVR